MENWIRYRPATFEYNGRWIKNWFSNFVPIPIIVDGIHYTSVENYYQAMKSLKEEDHWRIANLTPSQAKREGRKLKIRADWEEVKYRIMKQALIYKVEQNPKFRDQLLATGNEVLIEWNNWGDRIWGVDIKDNLGQNLLGKALMEVREVLVKQFGSL